MDARTFTRKSNAWNMDQIHEPSQKVETRLQYVIVIGQVKVVLGRFSFPS